MVQKKEPHIVNRRIEYRWSKLYPVIRKKLNLKKDMRVRAGAERRRGKKNRLNHFSPFHFSQLNTS